MTNAPRTGHTPTPTDPVFIGGVFKSGTSLLRVMLGRHPHIASGLETYWFDLPWPGLGETQHMLPEPVRRPIAPLPEQLDRLARFYEIPLPDVERMANAAGTPEAFLDEFLSAYAARCGKLRWLEKTPGNVLHLDRLYGHWPRAKVIHIIRHPLDVFASAKEAGKWDTPEVFGTIWTAFFGAVEDAKQSGLATDNRLLEIRYETLVQDPEATMRAVLSFLGERWDPAVARHDGDRSDYEKVLAVSGKASTTLERLGDPISDSRIGIWRTIVSADERAALQSLADDAGVGKRYRQLADEGTDA
ncbi:MAG: sulfotransferase family protein [Planctomycetota bacterium]